MRDVDERFMEIAIECARLGRGAVEPNPMVGAVLVREGRELARGWHKAFGGPHAEAECLAAARQAGVDPRGATMYVTLEPCTAFAGKKTPPCAQALVKAGVARVVVGMLDADSNVRGRGVAELREAGIDVTVGVREAQVAQLLAAYVKLRTTGRPWVICKWAQTADGFLSLPPGEGRWITGVEARGYAHELRGLCDGVCVGIGTVLADDPLLTNRSGTGKQPARVVLDARLRIPPDCRLARSASQSPVLVVTARADLAQARSVMPQSQGTGSREFPGSPRHRRGMEDLVPPAVLGASLGKKVEVLCVPSSPDGVDLPALLDELGRRQWTYLLVEGGAKVLGSFVFSGLADELAVFVSPRRVAEAPKDLPRFDIADVAKRLPLTEMQERRFGPEGPEGDRLLSCRVRRSGR